MTTFEQVAAICAEYKDIDASTIEMTTAFQEDLEFDSLDTMELIMSFEDKFGVNIEVDENLKTVGDLVALIDEELEK